MEEGFPEGRANPRRPQIQRQQEKDRDIADVEANHLQSFLQNTVDPAPPPVGVSSLATMNPDFVSNNRTTQQQQSLYDARIREQFFSRNNQPQTENSLLGQQQQQQQQQHRAQGIRIPQSLYQQGGIANISDWRTGVSGYTGVGGGDSYMSSSTAGVSESPSHRMLTHASSSFSTDTDRNMSVAENFGAEPTHNPNIEKIAAVGRPRFTFPNSHGVDALALPDHEKKIAAYSTGSPGHETSIARKRPYHSADDTGKRSSTRARSSFTLPNIPSQMAGLSSAANSTGKARTRHSVTFPLTRETSMLGSSLQNFNLVEEESRSSKSSSPSIARVGLGAMDTDSLLHNSCKLYPETLEIVESALQLDPSAIRRRIPINCTSNTKQSSNSSASSRKKRAIASPKYGYPINIAIRCRANIEIIKLLIRSGPDVLILPDGPERATSLCVALQTHAEKEVVEAIFAANPDSSSLPDRHLNLPLHWAMRSSKTQRDLDFVTRLHAACPRALSMRNFHTETPLDVAVRQPRCSEDIINFFQGICFAPLEKTAIHLDVMPR